MMYKFFMNNDSTKFLLHFFTVNPLHEGPRSMDLPLSKADSLKHKSANLQKYVTLAFYLILAS